AWAIAFFDADALHFIEVERGCFVRRRVEALLACAFGIGGHDHRLENAFLRRGDVHVDFDMTTFTMGIVCVAKAGILADGFILDLLPFNGPSPARLEPLLLRTFLLAAGDESNGIQQARWLCAAA